MKTHRPLFWIAIAFMFGIGFDAALHLPPAVVVGLLATGIVLATVFFRRRWSGIFFLLAVAAMGALLVRQATALPQDHITAASRIWRGKEVALKGVVTSDVDVRQAGRRTRVSFVLSSEEVCREARCRRAAGRVLVTLFTPVEVTYGDELVLRGKLHRPFEYAERGHGSYRDYLRRRGILLALTVPKANAPVVVARGRGRRIVALSLKCRRALGRVYETYLSRPEAGVMTAFMLGDRSGIPPHVRELFVRTGTAHVIAISGLNIAMLVFMMFLALSVLPIGRAAQTVFTVVLISAYAFLVGGGSPVVRSVVMSGIFLVSFLIEREQDKLNTLAAAALVILAVDPVQLFDVGFELSFVCVLSLLVGTPILLAPFEAWGWNTRPVVWFFIESLAVSLAAWLGSAGLVAYYFGMATPIGLLANIPVVPLTAIVTALGASLLIVAFVASPLAACFAICLKVALNLMVLCLWLCSLVPGGAGQTRDVTMGGIIIYYLILGGLFGVARWFLKRLSPVRDLWGVGL